MPSERRDAGETAELSAVSVAHYGNVHRREVRAIVVCDALCKQNESRARSENGQSVFYHSAHFFGHSEVAEQFAYDRGFASGDYKSVERAAQIAFLTYFKTVRSEFVKHVYMLDKRALQTKYAYAHYLPRSALRSEFPAR